MYNNNSMSYCHKLNFYWYNFIFFQRKVEAKADGETGAVAGTRKRWYNITLGYLLAN